MNENLENKVCLITGATNGIGLEESAKVLSIKWELRLFLLPGMKKKRRKLQQQLYVRDSGREATADYCRLVLAQQR
jgi:short-subunit dehydrogenase